MMNYQEMSDRSIDLEVFQAIFGKDVFTKDADLRRKWERGVSYCNSWADAGPIIHDNRISIFSDSEDDFHSNNGDKVYCWNAISFDTGLQHNAESNPLRAAMIVFLRMKGGE